ncbi:MAG TPA: TIGR03118 family protein [Pseudonocardiaceae bacterium]|nr:TIGR03118 family protein [Pseudonocardiaceae bacterium]
MSLLRRPLVVVAAAAGMLALGVPAVASPGPSHHGDRHDDRKLAVQQVNLVSDVPGLAPLTDPDVANPWGLALLPTSPLWSANNATDVATLYTVAPGSATATKVPTVRPTFPDTPELPTGQVANAGTGFVNTLNGVSAPARFIFSTLTGHIEAWAPGLDPGPGPTETRATVPGAVYTGLALATASTGDQLYAANFGQNRIDVFDSNFTQVNTPSWAFRDRHEPRGYAPFGVQALNGNIFVAYAKVDPKTGRSQDGVGLGIVDEFTVDGRLIARVASHQTLDGPWGMAIAPASWGTLAGSLLVGNFGNGRINVISLGRADNEGNGNGEARIVGQLRDSHGRTLSIERLWALLPGTATTGGTDAVFFSAGINNEQNGLIGLLRP